MEPIPVVAPAKKRKKKEKLDIITYSYHKT